MGVFASWPAVWPAGPGSVAGTPSDAPHCSVRSMYPPDDTEGRWASHFASQQREAEARLEKVLEDRAKKRFLESYQRREREGRFGPQEAAANSFFRRTLTKIGFFRRPAQNTWGEAFQRSQPNIPASTWTGSGWAPASPAVRQIMFGDTNGFHNGLSGAAVRGGQVVPQDALWKAFREIDRDQDGFVSVRDIVKAIRRCGVDASSKNVESLLSECGYSKTAKLGVDQFVHFFRTAEKFALLIDEEVDYASCCVGHCSRFLVISLLGATGVLLMLLVSADQEKDEAEYNMLLMAILICGIAMVPLMCCGICWPALYHCVRGSCVRVRNHSEAAATAEVATSGNGNDAGRQKPYPGFRTTMSWLEEAVEGRQGKRVPGKSDNASRRPSVDSQQAYDPSHYAFAREAGEGWQSHRAGENGGFFVSAGGGALSSGALSSSRPARNAPAPGPAWSSVSWGGSTWSQSDGMYASAGKSFGGTKEWGDSFHADQDNTWAQAAPVQQLDVSENSFSIRDQSTPPSSAGSPSHSVQVQSAGGQRDAKNVKRTTFQKERITLQPVPEKQAIGAYLTSDVEVLDVD